MISLQVFPRIRAVRTRGPDRKKLDRWNARQQPIKFKDSGFRTGKMLKVAEHSFLVLMRYLSLFSNHWQLGSQNWQGASSTKEDCILICFIGLGTVTMATQLVVNQH